MLAVVITGWDGVVLAGYVGLLVCVGWSLSRREARTTKDYFVASRSMPTWAVAVSILATAQSAATFMGAPQQGASGDLRYLLANVGVVIAAVVVWVVFLPAYFRLNVQTPYELLERAYGTPVRRMASVWYLGGRLMASGARVYIGAVPFCLAVFGEVTGVGLLVCIAGFMLFGALFTLASGARGAIWSDVVQVGVYLGAAVVLGVVLVWRLPAGDGSLLARAFAGPGGGGVVLIGPAGDNWDFSKPFTLLTAVTGWMLLNLAFFAMDQDLTQRLLSCKSAAHAARSLLLNTVVITLPVVGGFVLLGMLLSLYFAGPAGSASSGLPAGTELITRFAFEHSPVGVAGLMLAGVLAAGPAGINSSLNAMASSFINDLYRPLRPGLAEGAYVRAGRVATVVIGVAMAVFAALCVYWHEASRKSIIDFAMGVMVFAYAGLIGVFVAAVVFKKLAWWSGVGALVVGLGVVVGLQGTGLATPWVLTVGAGAAVVVASLGVSFTPEARSAQRGNDSEG